MYMSMYMYIYIYIYIYKLVGTLIWDWQLAYLAIGTFAISMVLALAPVFKTTPQQWDCAVRI